VVKLEDRPDCLWLTLSFDRLILNYYI
jgi:hypothetical protein